LRQISSSAFKRRFGSLIHTPAQAHFPEHHLGTRGEILVDGNSVAMPVLKISRFLPRGTTRSFAGFQASEHHDVRGDFSVRVFLKASLGRRTAPNNSARGERYSRKTESSLSMVPLDVMNIRKAAGRTRSSGAA